MQGVGGMVEWWDGGMVGELFWCHYFVSIMTRTRVLSIKASRQLSKSTMATPKSLQPLVRPLTRHSLPDFLAPCHVQRRTFLPNPFSSANPLSSPSSSPQTETLEARRTLPYASAPIYSIIADISSYSSFLPYCQSSVVTSWSQPDAKYNRRWPSQATLTIGYGQLVESFISNVFCVPGRVVESVAGFTQTSLLEEEIQHHLKEKTQNKGLGQGEQGLLYHLRSRWTLDPVGRRKTDVKLHLEFAFANPMYAILSRGATPKVAEIMVKAFEERVRGLLDINQEMANASLETLDGSQLGQQNQRL